MSTIQVIAVMERLAWAHKHIDAANKLSNTCVNNHFYELSAKQERKRRLVVRVEKVLPYPREFNLMVGDAAHNIRAALDNLAFAIVKPIPGMEKNIYFPICKSRKRFLDVAPQQLAGVSRQARAAFERLQPYHRWKMPEARYLAMLNALNNWDKHRELAVCATVAGGITFFPIVTGPHAISAKRVKLGILKKGAIFAVFQISKTTGESDVKMRPEIMLTPVFDIRMPKEVRGRLVIEVLRRSLWFVERTVIPSLRRFI